MLLFGVTHDVRNAWSKDHGANTGGMCVDVCGGTVVTVRPHTPCMGVWAMMPCA